MATKQDILDDISNTGLFLGKHDRLNLEKRGYDIKQIASELVGIYYHEIPKDMPTAEEVKTAAMNYRRKQIGIELNYIGNKISNSTDSKEYINNLSNSLAAIYGIGRQYALEIPDKTEMKTTIKNGFLHTISEGKHYYRPVQRILGETYGIVINEREIEEAKEKLLDEWIKNLIKSGFKIPYESLRRPQTSAEELILDNLEKPALTDNKQFKAHGVLLDTEVIVEDGMDLIKSIDEHARAQKNFEVDGYVIGDFDGYKARIKNILLKDFSAQEYISLPEGEKIEMEEISHTLHGFLNADRKEVPKLPLEVSKLLPEQIGRNEHFVPIANGIIGTFHTHPSWAGVLPSAQDAKAYSINNITEFLHSQGYPSLNMLSIWDQDIDLDISSFDTNNLCFFTFIGKIFLEDKSKIKAEDTEHLGMRRAYETWLERFVPIYLGDKSDTTVNGIAENVIMN